MRGYVEHGPEGVGVVVEICVAYVAVPGVLRYGKLVDEYMEGEERGRTQSSCMSGIWPSMLNGDEKPMSVAPPARAEGDRTESVLLNGSVNAVPVS